MQHVFELLLGLVAGVGACRDHRGLVEGQEVTTADDHLLYEPARELLSNERRWPSSNGARSRSRLRDARREFESASVRVEPWWLGAAKAQEMAEAECATCSRVALMRLTADLDETNYVFDGFAQVERLAARGGSRCFTTICRRELRLRRTPTHPTSAPNK
jgi:hypothetical protein